MSLKRQENWFLGLFITLLGGFLFLVVQSHYVRVEVTTLSQENQTLSQRNQVLSQNNENLRYYYDLATEFAIDPMIVTLVDQYARESMSDSGPEWRLVRTPEFMTYIMLSLIYVESKGDTYAVGDGGKARGLTQLWVSTARQYGDVTPEQLHLPETNISFSFKHFRYLLKKYRGNLALALYAWNRGEGKVDKLLIYGESPQNGYAKKVYEAALLNNRDWLLTSAQ
jgi:cell division protein FtsB